VQATGFLEQRERPVDLAGLLVAAEEIAHLGAGDAVGPVLREGPYLVGGWVAEAVAEDPARGVEAVVPEGERRFEVGEGDRGTAVERGVEGGEADDVRFGAPGGRAEQAFFAAPQRPVDVDPAFARVAVEGQPPRLAGAAQRGLDGVADARGARRRGGRRMAAPCCVGRRSRGSG
jgi:hypothetical protein